MNNEQLILVYTQIWDILPQHCTNLPFSPTDARYVCIFRTQSIKKTYFSPWFGAGIMNISSLILLLIRLFYFSKSGNRHRQPNTSRNFSIV